MREQSGPHKTFPGWTPRALITALVIGLIIVALSGVVSYDVADHTSREQAQETAHRAVSSQQSQQLLRLQKTAGTIDEDSQSVAVYASRCSAKGKKWARCVFDAPDYYELLAAFDTLGTIVDSTTDQQADSLALRLSENAGALMRSTTMQTGISDLGDVTSTGLDLDQRCGLLIQGDT